MFFAKETAKKIGAKIMKISQSD